MTQVGIRQLREQTSAVVRRVRSGEMVEITDHGHPVARIVPLGNSLGELIAQGRLTPAAGSGAIWEYEPPPLSPAESSVSEALAQLRANER